MGPDCGTAYVNGVGLGFANVVPRGRVGCVAASGTGLQAVVSRLAAAGRGRLARHRRRRARSLGRGRRRHDHVGARGAGRRPDDGGHRGDLASRRRPPSCRELEAAIGRIDKPVVVCCLGARPAASGRRAVGEHARRRRGGGRRDPCVATPWTPRLFADPADVRARLARARRRRRVEPRARSLHGRHARPRGRPRAGAARRKHPRTVSSTSATTSSRAAARIR